VREEGEVQSRDVRDGEKAQVGGVRREEKPRPRRGEINLEKLRRGDVEGEPPEKRETAGELDDYRKRIKEIKKRIGID
jgi:hypothetical protein